MKQPHNQLSFFDNNDLLIGLLSKETEILTRNKGWVTMDDICNSDLVAQYKNGVITFVNPIKIVKTKTTNKTIEVNGSFVSINITDNYALLIGYGRCDGVDYAMLKFRKTKVSNIVNKVKSIIVSGYAKEDNLIVKQDKLVTSTDSRFIAQNSYNYRIKYNMSKVESKTLAQKMLEGKKELKYKNPPELSLDECRFIGFFLGDGCRHKTKNNGEHFLITQSFATPQMIEWIESILLKCNIQYSYKDTNGGKSIICGKECNVSGHRRWLLSKGTGGYSQKNNGLYGIIPYLGKEGTDLFWGFNRDQYFALMEGLFKADGEHGNNKEYKGGKIVGMYKKLFDLLQAIGVCRGYRVTIKSSKMRKNNKKQLYNISLYDKRHHQLTHDKFKINQDTSPKQAWNVIMPNNSIITRLNGTVTIL